MIGFSGDQFDWGGTYHHSHTFFDAAVQHTREKTDDLEEMRPSRIRIQVNRHADFNFRTHVNVCDSAETNQDQERKAWVRALRPGDRIQLFAKAKYPAWTNYVQSARIMVRYLGIAAEAGNGDSSEEEMPQRLQDLNMLDQPTREADPSHQPRIVIYHQSLHAENGILTSLRPLVREKTGVTAVILGTFYLRKKATETNSGAVIYLNDFATDDPSIDGVWDDIEYLHREGVKVLGMLNLEGDELPATERNWLGGNDNAAFELCYRKLHDLAVSKNLDGFEFDLESHMPQILTNTEEDSVSLDKITQLFDRLHFEIKSQFTIAVSASAEALCGINGDGKESGIDYQTLERRNGQLIDWYNVRVFSNNLQNDDQFNAKYFPPTFKGWRVEEVIDEEFIDPVSRFVNELSPYIRLLQDNLYRADKLLIALLTTSNAVTEATDNRGAYIRQDILTSLLELIRWSYGPMKFGGVAGWEYWPPRGQLTAEPARGFESPCTWVNETKEILESVFSQNELV